MNANEPIIFDHGSASEKLLSEILHYEFYGDLERRLEQMVTEIRRYAGIYPESAWIYIQGRRIFGVTRELERRRMTTPAYKEASNDTH